MKYIYDGTFDGLMTVVFDAYKIIEKINIKEDADQIEMFENIFVKTDIEKASRVKKGIASKFSKGLITEFLEIHSSDNPNKADTIARCIKGIYNYGINFLTSADEWAVNFVGILKNFRNEVHDYKGLLRFREIQEDFLLAEITPHNDILMFLTPHFLSRMPNEKFIIYDVNRKKAAFCICGKCELMIVESLTAKNSDREEFFKAAWMKFYETVGIDERRNKKLMISNMPKKYWKYLPEKQNRKE